MYIYTHIYIYIDVRSTAADPDMIYCYLGGRCPRHWYVGGKMIDFCVPGQQGISQAVGPNGLAREES